jgi:biotin transport system substrate-specific component
MRIDRMTQAAAPASSATRPLLLRAAIVLALTIVLAASARAQVPFWPVPMTLQTLAVLGIAGLAGPGIAGATMLGYLAEGAAGLPVFAGTPAHGIGLAYLAGPTGGYLAGMLVASVVVGALVRRAGGHAGRIGGAMLLGIVIVYACGAAWLAQFVGADRALALGVTPFLLGDAIKATLATALVLALGRSARAAS